MRPPCSASLLLLVVAMTGCAVGPDYRAPNLDPGRGWIEPAGDDDSPCASRWWDTFDDPTLTRLVERARSTALDVRRTAATIAEARALRDAAAGRRLPSVDAEASVTRRRQSENGPLPIAAIPGLEPEQTIYEAGFDASWEIDLFGRTRRAVEAADARLGAEIARLEAVRLAVEAEIARTYLELRGAQREREILEAVAGLARRREELVRNQVELGEVSPDALAVAEAAAARAEAALPSLRGRIRASALAIGVLAGDLPEAELDLEDDVPQPVALRPIPIGARAEILRRRPDVAAAERRLAAATAEIGVAKADLFPRLAIGASGGFQALDAGDLLQSASRTWSIAPLISWRIFEGGRVRAEIRAAEARTEAAALAYEQAVLEALGDAERALARYRAGLGEVERRADVLDASRDGLEIARLRFAAGDVSALEVLEAAGRLEEARLDAARARTNAAIALVGLSKALGGGFEEAAVEAGGRTASVK